MYIDLDKGLLELILRNGGTNCRNLYELLVKNCCFDSFFDELECYFDDIDSDFDIIDFINGGVLFVTDNDDDIDSYNFVTIPIDNNMVIVIK